MPEIITKSVLTGDGITSSYTIPFDYLSRSHVHITVDGEAEEYEYTNAKAITFASPPPKDSTIIIERITPYDEAWITWTDGTVQTANDLNAQLLQVLFVLQENKQSFEGLLSFNDLLSAYDALGNRLTNLGDPQNPQDAVTYKLFLELFEAVEDLKQPLEQATTEAQEAMEKACACAARAVEILTQVEETGQIWLDRLNSFLPPDTASRFFILAGRIDGGNSVAHTQILAIADGGTSATVGTITETYDGQRSLEAEWYIVNPELAAALNSQTGGNE